MGLCGGVIRWKETRLARTRRAFPLKNHFNVLAAWEGGVGLGGGAWQGWGVNLGKGAPSVASGKYLPSYRGRDAQVGPYCG